LRPSSHGIPLRRSISAVPSVAVNIPCITTVQGASAAVQGIEAGIRGDIGVRSLQELHRAIDSRSADR
ncbi:hypothetical protein, partial [Mycobacterium ostraviense]|uniref:hypothetical protein n=1 Tax=Mycobacterium ostraviense TaxID=2738409 RepID=UPI001379E8D9